MRITEFNKPVQKTKQDKRVSPRYKKRDYVQMLSDMERYPMIIRVAAELFRGGVTGRRFLDEFHLEGNPISTQVHMYMVQFDLQKGQNPERVPRLLPEMLRYVPTAKMKEIKEAQKRGRPTHEEAKEYLQKMLKELQSKGWKEVDFINALRELVDGDNEPVATIKLEDDDEVEADTKKPKGKHSWHVRIGKKWNNFDKQGDALKAMESDDESDGITAPVDIPSKRVHCAYCKFKLTGTCVVVRDGKNTEEMHMGCYWMNVAHPSRVPIGMSVLDAATGKYYTYYGPEKGRWKMNEEQPDETTDSEADGGERIPAPEGQSPQQPAAIPTPATA